MDKNGKGNTGKQKKSQTTSALRNISDTHHDFLCRYSTKILMRSILPVPPGKYDVTFPSKIISHLTKQIFHNQLLCCFPEQRNYRNLTSMLPAASHSPGKASCNGHMQDNGHLAKPGSKHHLNCSDSLTSFTKQTCRRSSKV